MEVRKSGRRKEREQGNELYDDGEVKTDYSSLTVLFSVIPRFSYFTSTFSSSSLSALFF